MSTTTTTPKKSTPGAACQGNYDCPNGGVCQYDGDYNNPVKKCYYPCTSDSQCTDLGPFTKCNNSSGHCAISDTPPEPEWASLNIRNEVQKNNQKNSEIEEDLLNNVQNLQTLEQYLINLLNNPNLSDQEKEEIVNKIENLTQMRINLYKNLVSLSGYYAQNMLVSDIAISDQKNAVDIMENELNKLKEKADEANQSKLNKLRSIEINNYYSSRYLDHANVLKTGLLFLFGFLILYALKSKDLLPDTVFNILLYILVALTVYFMGKMLLDMWTRNAFNYQQYDWNFNPNMGPSSSTGTATTSASTLFSTSNILSEMGISTCPTN